MRFMFQNEYGNLISLAAEETLCNRKDAFAADRSDFLQFVEQW